LRTGISASYAVATNWAWSREDSKRRSTLVPGRLLAGCDGMAVHLMSVLLMSPSLRTVIGTRLPALAVTGSKTRPGNDTVRDQGTFCKIVGGVLSPLLANIYMRRFVHGWKTLGHERRLNAAIVNYADDLVICCRGTADEAMTAMRAMMSKLKLTVNEAKTRVCRIPEETFDFLGYTIGRCYSPRTGRSYIGTRPSAKKIARLRDEIREITDRRWTWTEAEDRVARLNRLLLGWSNYFCLGPVSRAYRAIDRHCCTRLRRWLCAKHQVKTRGTSRFPDQYLYDELGLIRLSARTKSFPWANA
jgi:RNA-directed DNA polymerase